MSTRIFKYLSPFLIYYGSLAAFLSTGFVVWLPLVYSWIVIPLCELFIKADEMNLSEAEEELAKKNKWYDVLLYLVVPFQYIGLAVFLYSITYVQQPWIDIVGKTLVMGLLCGVMGINVGHELGHRVNKLEQFLAKSLLLTSLYMHFIIEHNKGHHKRVATPEDPSSARYGEMIYSFWMRTIVYSYISAWKIANSEMRKAERAVFSLYNEMVQVHLIELTFNGLIYIVFGGWSLLCYLLAA